MSLLRYVNICKKDKLIPFWESTRFERNKKNLTENIPVFFLTRGMFLCIYHVNKN